MKNLSLFLSFLILVICLFLVSDQSHAEKSLKIGSDEWPPFHSAGKSEKDVKGFTADLVRAVLKKMNVKIAVRDERFRDWFFPVYELPAKNS